MTSTPNAPSSAAVADLPVEIRMEIRRTPAAGAKYDDIYELIANVDRVYFLMGRTSRRRPARNGIWPGSWNGPSSRSRTAALSPAGREFIRSAPVQWQRFRHAGDLARLVTLDLVRILQHPTNRYGLTVTELELLALHAKQIQRGQTDITGQVAEPGGAEGGGIILDRGRREPLDGVALDEDG
ncbi:MAG: hypothetical protein R3A10_06585 [Caldilineaceae bacterium]